MTGRREPTSAPQPATKQTGGDAQPPAPPRELPAPQPLERRFHAGDVAWSARLSGKAACGTGAYGLGLVDAVHFYLADAPERPVREALLAHGRFDFLFDSELVALLETATPIVKRA